MTTNIERYSPITGRIIKENNNTINIADLLEIVYNSDLSAIKIQNISLPETPTCYNVILTNALTEYSQVLPSNTKKFVLSVRSGDGTKYIRYAYITGKVQSGVSPYIEYANDVIITEDNINFTGTIYLSSDLAGSIVQILTWS